MFNASFNIAGLVLGKPPPWRIAGRGHSPCCFLAEAGGKLRGHREDVKLPAETLRCLWKNTISTCVVLTKFFEENVSSKQSETSHLLQNHLQPGNKSIVTGLRLAIDFEIVLTSHTERYSVWDVCYLHFSSIFTSPTKKGCVKIQEIEQPKPRIPSDIKHRHSIEQKTCNLPTSKRANSDIKTKIAPPLSTPVWKKWITS